MPIEGNKFSWIIVEAMKKLGVSDEKILSIREKLELDEQYDAPIYVALEVDDVPTLLKSYKPSGIDRLDLVTVLGKLPVDHHRTRALEKLLEYNFELRGNAPAHFCINSQDEVLMCSEKILAEVDAEKLVNLIVSAVDYSRQWCGNYFLENDGYAGSGLVNGRISRV